jgi:hypothetical protein
VERLRETNESAAVCQKHVNQFARDGCLVCDAEAARAEGRREALEEAAKMTEHDYCFCRVENEGCPSCQAAAAIRALDEG